MNKKEVSEIKKQFKQDNGLLAIGKMVSAYITEQDEIEYIETRHFGRLEESEQDLYLNAFKKSLTGGIGKNLIECKFEETAYDDDGIQKEMTKLLNEELGNDENNKQFIEKLKDTLGLKERYYVSIAFCQYSVPPEKGKKKADDEDDIVDYTDFNFLICTMNAMKLTEIGLYFNSDARIIEKKSNLETEVLKGPFAGFLYPTFSSRTADVNNVLVFTKDKGQPNLNLVKDFLNVEYDIGCNEELEKFTQVIKEVCGDDLEFDIGKKIYTQLNDILEQNCLETEQPTIGYKELEKILINSGIDECVANEVETAFEEVFEDKDTQLKVVNLTNENKTIIKTADANIAIKVKETPSIQTKMIDGRKCLVIPLEDNNITINDIEVQ